MNTTALVAGPGFFMTKPQRESVTADVSRRNAIASMFAIAAVGQAQEPVTIPGKRAMILHNDRPEDLETPLAYFDQWQTPNDAFFVRQHLPRPVINEADYRVSLGGRTEREIQLSLADIRKLPQHKIAAVLECTGNGRGFYQPRVPGIQWGRGAVGNAEWSGPRLIDVLKLAGADLGAGYVTLNGADVGLAKTPDFIRSLPMRKAIDPNTLLAMNMNGERLPDLHGFPLRLVTPGWDGTSWVKWVNSLTVANEQDQGFFMNPAYRFPKHPGLTGQPVDRADLEVIEGMPVKSYITGHADGDKIRLAATTLRGMAWAGEERITKVDVSTDGGSTWKSAELSEKGLPYTWRLWTLEWRPPAPGYFTVMSRATDSAGRVQPVVATWNPSGYLFNAIDRIGLLVEAAS
jgi:DMSO/TMAO reductase YedYZ molybdopterin-dependent catalytic subunit